MAALRESGFFSTEPLQVEGQLVRPLAVTAKLLFDQWKLHPGEEDFTVMRVVLEGRKDGRQLRYTYDLLDSYDCATKTTSMARTDRLHVRPDCPPSAIRPVPADRNLPARVRGPHARLLSAIHSRPGRSQHRAQ